jgi:hypothetical protein
MFTRLWAALAAGEVLQAEIETARCCSVFLQFDMDREKSDSIFIRMAKQGGKPEDAALLRLIMLLGSAAVKGQARTALGELTAKGVYPASWVAEAGKAEPVRAWREYDVFGDWEDIYLTFRYESGEHTLVSRVDLAALPQVRRLALISGEPPESEDRAFTAIEEISFAHARAQLEPSLLVAEIIGMSDPDSRVVLPVAKARLRRLPSDGAEASRVYTGDDRTALVREFLASAHAAEAVAADEESTRFWAEILTAWSSRIPEYPPLRAGPRTLRYILNEHAPHTYSFSTRQREHMEQAVTAWARWSAAQRGLDENHMLSMLPVILSDFEFFHQVPDAAEQRAYLADIATSGADVRALQDARATRMIAIPYSKDRDQDGTASLDGADPDDRATYLAAEFGECELPGGMSRDDFIGVVSQVAEELWDVELSGTRAHALALLAEDRLDRHDIIHALVRHALSTRS